MPSIYVKFPQKKFAQLITQQSTYLLNNSKLDFDKKITSYLPFAHTSDYVLFFNYKPPKYKNEK